ncbi:GIY-YIG nuclease family protein [Vibrio hannami]|uniref:GIY-YIG nuclease family protein n=1 Tax=Vibrio hannami TaxID=2717094 RepID=UPI00240FE3B0|nr:GIY-YIG nuclease family protein [Vibrio hannami]MDG3085216.1 GIY-YIG nuclease family protein [Vibrio hannami]
MTSESPVWWVYLIRTNYGALYCGITTNLERRFAMHQKGTGAKALRGKGPLKMVWWEHAGSKSDALKREISIKKLNKSEKEVMVSQFELETKDVENYI